MLLFERFSRLSMHFRRIPESQRLPKESVVSAGCREREDVLDHHLTGGERGGAVSQNLTNLGGGGQRR